MRTIKFRVWDNTKQQMFLVRELFWRENPYEMVGNYWFLENEDDEYGKEVWFPRTEANGSKHTASLMQFTGLTDRLGKEIYEGDIVHDPLTGKRYPVVFENGAFRANGLVVCNAFPNDEVIGNIYEHPELIQK